MSRRSDQDRGGPPDAADVDAIVAALVASHGREVYSIVRRACRGNGALADDAFQETFVRFLQWLRANPRGLAPADVEPLLATFARRAAVDALRREWRHLRKAGIMEHPPQAG